MYDILLISIKPQLILELLLKSLCFPSGELPGNQTLYEYFYDGDKKQWIPWSKLVPKYIHDPALKFYEILVPTVDTVSIFQFRFFSLSLTVSSQSVSVDFLLLFSLFVNIQFEKFR